MHLNIYTLKLKKNCMSSLTKLSIKGWCKQYCDEHWSNEHWCDNSLNWNVSSMNELFLMLEASSYHNPINLGLLRYLITKPEAAYLMSSVEKYIEIFFGNKIEDFISEITVIGNLSRKESTAIVSTLLENQMTIGEIWKLCTPRITKCSVNVDNHTIEANTLVLDASDHLRKFYSDVKDNETFLTRAKQENLVIDFQHIKILVTGSAAVGKTSFCHLLFRSKYSSEYKSTEVLEASQAMSIVNFSMLKQKTNKIVWLKLDPKNQISHLKSLLKSRVFHQIKSPEITQDTAAFNITAQEVLHHTTDSGDDPKTDVEKKILSSSPLHESIKIDKNETVKFITVIDSGGQPEYIHMLPAINTCPTINFVVLDMTKDLDDQVMIQYRSNHNKNFADYPLQYSNLDMIGLLMSFTTDSLEQPTKQAPSRRRLSIPSRCFIGFIGTHKDKLEKESRTEKITALNDRLISIVEERDCKFAVLPADNGILFAVDNTTAGDSNNEDRMVKMLRQKIEDFMAYEMKSSESTDNQLPIRWMLLELELQELHQNNGAKYIHYEEYKRIAIEKASMVPEEVEECLQHFDFLGVLLHFKEVPGLCNYVIIDHQWLFDSLAMIMHLSPDDIDFQDHIFKKQFKENRLLAESELCIINWDNELSPQYFFNLLVYLKVIATVTVTLNEVKYYYMPCILSSTKHYNDKYRFLYSKPLLVQFSSGFLPRGFFCSLVVHLLQNSPDGWDHQLHNTEHFSNVITFRLPDKSFLRLHDKTLYLEIQIRHYTKELCFSYYSKVFPVLSQYFEDVCNKLNFNHNKLQYGFLCHDAKSNDDHIAVIDPCKVPFPTELECCRKCPHPTKLGEFHKIWFNEIDGAGIDDSLATEGQLGSSQDVQKIPTHILTKEPEMWQLYKFVVPHIMACWEDVAFVSFHYNISTVQGIEASCKNDTKKCCQEILKKWLNTSSVKTWETLLTQLQEVEDLKAAVEEIKKNISNV